MRSWYSIRMCWCCCWLSSGKKIAPFSVGWIFSVPRPNEGNENNVQPTNFNHIKRATNSVSIHYFDFGPFISHHSVLWTWFWMWIHRLISKLKTPSKRDEMTHDEDKIGQNGKWRNNNWSNKKKVDGKTYFDPNYGKPYVDVGFSYAHKMILVSDVQTDFMKIH